VRRWSLCLFALLLAGGAGPVNATTLLLVRHAQKAQGEDPVLTEAGAAWAERLAAAIASAGVSAIYVTDTRRSALTAAPAARSGGLTPLVRSRTDAPAHAAALATELRARSDTDVVLAVEHSDTVPLVLKSLGVANPPTLGDQDYGDVFVVTWSAAAAARPPSVLRLRL